MHRASYLVLKKAFVKEGWMLCWCSGGIWNYWDAGGCGVVAFGHFWILIVKIWEPEAKWWFFDDHQVAARIFNWWTGVALNKKIELQLEMISGGAAWYGNDLQLMIKNETADSETKTSIFDQEMTEFRWWFYNLMNSHCVAKDQTLI